MAALEPIDRTVRFLLLTQHFPPEVGAPQVRLLALAQQSAGARPARDRRGQLETSGVVAARST